MFLFWKIYVVCIHLWLFRYIRNHSYKTCNTVTQTCILLPTVCVCVYLSLAFDCISRSLSIPFTLMPGWYILKRMSIGGNASVYVFVCAMKQGIHPLSHHRRWVSFVLWMLNSQMLLFECMVLCFGRIAVAHCNLSLTFGKRPPLGVFYF